MPSGLVTPNKEEILRLCSYKPEDLHRLLILSSPAETNAIGDLLRTAFSTPPTASLGILDQRLPFELIALILPKFDVLSYIRFRQVNRRARIICTEVLREYVVVATYGLDGLRALIRGNLGYRFTVMDLYRVLTTRDCMVCGEFFGGFIYLPSATRCCFPCIRTAEELRVLGTNTFCRLAGVKLSEARPHILGATLRTVPGRYVETLEPAARRPKNLVSVKDALEALATHGVAFHQPPREPEIRTAAEARRSDSLAKRFMACTALPWYDADTARPESGVSCTGCLRRHIFSEMREADRATRERMFSSEGFLAHFDSCWDAKTMWAKRPNGQ